MRLKLLLPPGLPDTYPERALGPYDGCEGTRFRRRQDLRKPVQDTLVSQVSQVVARRYQCVRCERTFRVYPTGGSKAHNCALLKGLAVLLYVLGLSYGAVWLALEALAIP